MLPDKVTDIKDVFTGLTPEFKKEAFSIKINGVPLLEYDFSNEEWLYFVGLLFSDIRLLQLQNNALMLILNENM